MNKKRIITTTLLIVLILLSFIGGTTLAKYLSSYTNNVTSQVAKWSINNSFLVNGNNVTSTPINLATTYDSATLVDGKIAPGTSGSFGIKIDGTGTETGIKYRVTFTNVSTQHIENLKFTYKGKTYSNLSTLENDLSGTISAENKNKVVNIEIGWQWPYETLDSYNSSKIGDSKDLEIGKSAPAFGFDVNITCTQISPKTTA